MITDPVPRSSLHVNGPVPTWKAIFRKCATMATVVRLARSEPNDVGGLEIEIRRLVRLALAAPTVQRKVLNLWRIEGLVFKYCDRRADPELSLRRSSMPLEAGPPAHCGLAMAAVLQEGFDPERLGARFSMAADPRFIRFCHETTGLMLAIADSGLLGGLVRAAGSVGVLGARLDRPADKAGFFAAGEDDRRRLVAHGFGRALYFTSLDLQGAVSRVLRERGLPADAALRGLSGANALVNSRDLDLLLERGGDGFPPEVIGGFEGGLANTLCLLEWTIPGALRGLTSSREGSRRMIDAAVAEARSARLNGLGPPMRA